MDYNSTIFAINQSNAKAELIVAIADVSTLNIWKQSRGRRIYGAVATMSSHSLHAVTRSREQRHIAPRDTHTCPTTPDFGKMALVDVNSATVIRSTHGIGE